MQAPITEEVVFRACVLTVYHLAQASKLRMIFLSPLLFGAGEDSCPHVQVNTCLPPSIQPTYIMPGRHITGMGVAQQP
jgi:hypothetical protein